MDLSREKQMRLRVQKNYVRVEIVTKENIPGDPSENRRGLKVGRNRSLASDVCIFIQRLIRTTRPTKHKTIIEALKSGDSRF